MVVFAAGLAVAFGLNSDPIENGLAGDADAAGLAAGETSAFWCPRVFAGEGEAPADVLVFGAKPLVETQVTDPR